MAADADVSFSMHEFIVACNLGGKLMLACDKDLNFFISFSFFVAVSCHINITVNDLYSCMFLTRGVFGGEE